MYNCTRNAIFVKVKNKYEVVVGLDGQEMLKSDGFRYLRSVIHKDKN